jgi:Cu/Ag efflux protein CusF
MLRLIHSQTVQGALLVDDIDDGLPNKQVHRLGTTADHNAYPRDGYANKPKQPCYVPRVKPTDDTVPGFIDLDETPRVVLSADRGKISGLQSASLISVVSLTAGDLTAPAISGATLDAPAAGDVTINGTNFLSVTPDSSSVHLFGAGVGDVTLTQAQIVAVAPGAISDTQIIIDSTLIAGLTSGDSIVVNSDDQDSNTFVLP